MGAVATVVESSASVTGRGFGECRVDDCSRVIWLVKESLCNAHCQQWRSGKAFRPVAKRVVKQRYTSCPFSGCVRPIQPGKTRCREHTSQMFNGLELSAIEQPKRVSSAARNGEGEKWCASCKSWLSESCFTRLHASLDGLNGRCRQCDAEYYRSKPEVNAARRLKYKYGIECFATMLAAQGSGCAICERKEATGNGWAIDHDHSCCPGDRSCGKCVRGILCTQCNMALGLLYENTNSMARMIEYMKGWASDA